MNSVEPLYIFIIFCGLLCVLSELKDAIFASKDDKNDINIKG